jgi:hypothetical protein
MESTNEALSRAEVTHAGSSDDVAPGQSSERCAPLIVAIIGDYSLIVARKARYETLRVRHKPRLAKGDKEVFTTGIMTPQSDTKKPMSDEHKAALAEGRAQGRAIRNYLEALDANKPKRGRKRTPESIARRFEAIEAELGSASPTKRLELVQERIDLESELAAMEDKPDMTALEVEFKANAKGYSDRKGISYAAWRELGVDAALLKDAGVTRGS